MSVSKERKLYLRVEFLKECGLDLGEIYRFLIKLLLFFGLFFKKNFVYKLVILVKIGYVYRIKDFVMVMGVVIRISLENM